MFSPLPPLLWVPSETFEAQCSCLCLYVRLCVYYQHTKEEVTFALQARAMEPQGAFVLSEPELCYAGAQQSAQAYNMPPPFYALLCVHKIQRIICQCFAIQLCFI